MRSIFLLGVVCGLSLVAIGCGGGDSDDSSAVASNTSSAPPPPPGPGATPAPAASASGATPGASSPAGSSSGGYADPAGAAASYPGGGLQSPGAPPPGAGTGSDAPGYAQPGAAGYPGGTYPGAGAEGGALGGGDPASVAGSYPPGTYPGAANAGGAYPGAEGSYPGSPDGAGGLAARKPPRPKSLREKAVDAFREGRSDEGVQLLSAHYLTNPAAGSELSRVMLWSPSLRKPALVTRIGVAVVYSSQPASYEGHPQPIGSPELEAALASMEQKVEGKGGDGGGRRVGGRRIGGRPNEGNPGAVPPGGIGGSGIEGGSGYGGGQNQMPTSPQEEVAYFTGEVGTKLLEKIKVKLEAGDFGAIYRDALKSAPLVVGPGVGGEEGGRSSPGALPPGVGPGGVATPMGGGNIQGIGQIGGAGYGQEGKAEGKGGGVMTGQLMAGVEFLGAAENVKELSDLAKAAGVDVLIYFEVRVRPATAIALVNNDTKFRIVAASEIGKQLFASTTLNNKKVHELRKGRGAEDPVAKEIDNAMAALEAHFKFVPLPALSPEQAMKRLTFLLDQKPEDATPLLLEARLFVAKKLLKPDEAVTLVLTTVSDDQLASLSEVVEEGDVKEQIGTALSGRRADAPTTVLGKFGTALGGAGGLGNLVPTVQLPPGGLPVARPPGGFAPGGSSGGHPGAASGYPAGYPNPSSGSPPPSGATPPSGLQPAGAGLAPAGSSAPGDVARPDRER
jgi:hypothetical protein